MGMDAVVFVVIGLVVAYGVVRNWHYPMSNMVSAEDPATMTGKQLVFALALIACLTALAATG